jgi:ferric-dicitrate binding protein FerR (iron transport regulator)
MSQKPSQGMSFAELMQAGRAALVARRRQAAHDYWKQAAKLQPQNEQVWLALLEVIDSESDRRVCLQNILQINPMNVQARRQLGRVEARLHRLAIHKAEQEHARKRGQQRRRSIFRQALFLGMAIGLSGALFAVVISILVYGR